MKTKVFVFIYLYLGWLMAYIYGSKQATNLHAHAGIIVIPGVNNSLFPKAPIIARTPYGVHERTKRKQIVIAACKKMIYFCLNAYKLMNMINTCNY